MIQVIIQVSGEDEENMVNDANDDNVVGDTNHS